MMLRYTENNLDITYSVEKSNTAIVMSFGVTEYVTRHPENWGFVFTSVGAVWTSFPMPRRGTDPYLEDSQLGELRKPPDFGFQF